MVHINKVRWMGTAVTLAALAAGLIGTPAPASAQATQCGAPEAPTTPGVAKNIDTTLGCDNTEGVASNPATGYITVRMGQTTSVQVLDVFGYTTGSGTAYFTGDYNLAFSNCSGGSGTGATYTLAEDGMISAQIVPTYTADSPGGVVSCRYSVTYTGTPPAGSERFFNAVQAEQSSAVSATVNRFDGPAPAVPEARLAALFVVVGAAAGWIMIRRSRRQQQAPSLD